MQCIAVLRNTVLIEKWNKYRKAYVFDSELEATMTDMGPKKGERIRNDNIFNKQRG